MFISFFYKKPANGEEQEEEEEDVSKLSERMDNSFQVMFAEVLLTLFRLFHVMSYYSPAKGKVVSKENLVFGRWASEVTKLQKS